MCQLIIQLNNGGNINKGLNKANNAKLLLES